MPTINQLLELKNALLKDHRNREAVITLLYDAFTGAFSDLSIEHLREASGIIGSVIPEIENAITRIREIGARENLCVQAVAILSEENKSLLKFYNDFFMKVKKIEMGSVGNEIIKKSIDLVLLLNKSRKKENEMIDNINRLIGSISEKRNEELFP